MRKILAILLLTVFGLPFATPLLAQSGSGDADVPVCCRRWGMHHCTGKATESSAPQWTSQAGKCPFCPQASVTAHHEIAGLSASAVSFAQAASQPCGMGRTHAMVRIVLDLSRPMRGPPSAFLA